MRKSERSPPLLPFRLGCHISYAYRNELYRSRPALPLVDISIGLGGLGRGLVKVCFGLFAYLLILEFIVIVVALCTLTL